MRTLTLSFLAAAALLAGCGQKKPDNPIIGTWQLLNHTEITNGKVTDLEDYTGNKKFIKIINDTHFAFLSHTINTPKDSSNKFDAGGGKYTLNGDKYTEHLDFYKDKNWEGQAFDFTISFSGDTLIQKGVEKVVKANVDHIIIEKYLRVK